MTRHAYENRLPSPFFWGPYFGVRFLFFLFGWVGGGADFLTLLKSIDGLQLQACPCLFFFHICIGVRHFVLTCAIPT